jgi:hypothetical protein
MNALASQVVLPLHGIVSVHGPSVLFKLANTLLPISAASTYASRSASAPEPEIDERRVARVVRGEFDSTRVTLRVDLRHGEVEVGLSGGLGLR